MELSLQNTYPGVSFPSGNSLGGNQRWVDDKTMQRCGCGVVAVLDLVRYLHLHYPSFHTSFFTGIPETAALSKPVYDLCAQRMRRSFVPILYPIGTTGIALASGLNRYFKRYHLPLTAKWGVPTADLWREIGSMLRQDIPVILSVGNCLALIRKQKGALFCRRSGEEMRETVRVRAHFVTVVGMDDEWLRISSWGKEYYLSKTEFLRYRSRESAGLLCNIVQIRRQANNT